MIAHRCGGCQPKKKSPQTGGSAAHKNSPRTGGSAAHKNSNGYFIFAQGGKGCQGMPSGGGWGVFFGGVVGGVLRIKMHILAI